MVGREDIRVSVLGGREDIWVSVFRRCADIWMSILGGLEDVWCVCFKRRGASPVFMLASWWLALGPRGELSIVGNGRL